MKNNNITVQTKNKVQAVDPTPEEALTSIDADVAAAGGAFEEPEEYKGSVARTMFDTPGSDDGTVTVLLTKENIQMLPRQSFVRIKSLQDKRSYVGVVVKGPFAEPDGLRADAPILVSVSVHGAILMPKYHGRAQVEISGEELEDRSIVPPRRRPLPNSPVFLLTPDEMKTVLKTRGRIRFGLVEGQDETLVNVPSDVKSVFPRHLGILGTTGGGKSTTVSGLVSQLQEEKASIVVIDTEGEYTSIHEPAEEPQMLKALERRNLEPKGVPGTTVYHLIGREPANPSHPDVKRFSLRFSELSPYAVMEILELTDAQQERFLKAYDIAKMALEKFKIFPTSDMERELLFDIDELDEGYPRLTLEQLYDIVKLIACMTAKDPDPYLETRQFYKQIDILKQIIDQASLPKSVPSWRALQGRINRVKRLKIFDSADAAPIAYSQLLSPGKVTIIDLKDLDSTQVRNLVIAQLLRGVQKQQDENYEAALKKGTRPTPTMIFIEEAHEFLSTQRIKQMEVLFQQVARIARRGRKRWLGLAFITQLPQHLPDEVLSLINNWILHKISDSSVVNRLRRSIGGIDESLWNRLPSLAAGQAVVSFTSLARPVQVTIDPTPCKLLMVD